MIDTLKKLGGYGAIIALAAVIAPLWVGAIGEANEAQTDVCRGMGAEVVDRPAKDFSLRALDGAERKLLANKAVLLHFWFTKCPPCVKELPSLAALQRGLAGQDVEILAVSVDERTEHIAGFLGNHGAAGLPVFVDPTKRISAAYGTSKFPESYLIDRAGRVRYRFVSDRDWSTPLAQECVKSVL